MWPTAKKSSASPGSYVTSCTVTIDRVPVLGCSITHRRGVAKRPLVK